MNNFEIESKLNSENTLYFTDDLVNHNKILKMGHNVKDFRQYFGYVNPRLYEIYKNAIKNLDQLNENVKNITYQKVPVIEGIKSYFLDRLIFLEKIKSILEENVNVVFLFTTLEYFYFAIPLIAKKIDPNSNCGIYEIKENNFMELNFNEHFKNNFSEFYENGVSDEDVGGRLELSFNLKTSIPKTGFFLVNNDEDFYLKPIYPILEIFKNTNQNEIFSFTKKTSIQLQEKNFQHTDLTKDCDDLELQMIKNNKKIIFDFLNEIIVQGNNNIVINAYQTILKNDRIIRNIGRILACIFIVKKIFQTCEFKSILVGVDGISENDITSYIANQFSVPTYSIPPAMTEYAPIYGVLYSANNLLLSGPRLKKELETIGTKKHLIPTGMPRYDYIKKKNVSKNSDINSNDKKLIIVAMSRMHNNDEEWISKLIHYCNNKNFNIIIKTHPLYKFIPDLCEIHDEKIEKINEKCFGLHYQISSEIDLSEYLPKAAIIITEYSLVGIEASLHEKPIIVANMDNEKFYDYSLQFHKEGIALYAENIDELFNNIEKILNEDIVNFRLTQARKKFNQEFNYLNDGKSAERIFQILS